MKKKISITDIIALAALVFSIITFVRGCKRDKILDTTQYKLNQVQFRPDIKFIKTHITSYRIKTDTIYKDSVLLQSPSEVINIPTYLTINTNIYLTNIGNAPCKIFGQFYTDTTSGERIHKTNYDQVKR